MPITLRTTTLRLTAFLIAASAILVANSGCGGPDYKARGIVKGKVTTGKKHLTTGSVMFHNANGISATASLDPTGNYVMNDAPIGDCVVTVTVTALPNDPSVRNRLKGGGSGPKIPEMKNPEAEGPGLPSAPAVPKEVVPIDPKFSNPDTSGLKFKVEKGEQTFDIEL